MADYFIFGDFDCRNYNMWIHERNTGRLRHLAPPKVNVTDRVIGSSGEFLFDQYYDKKDIPINVFLDMGGSNLMDDTMLREISSFLSRLGTQKLILSYEPYKYHNATFTNQVTGIEYSNGMIFEELKFEALNPFGYSRFITSEFVSGVYYDMDYYYDSGLLYSEDMGDYYFTNMTSGDTFEIYHGGNSDDAFPVFEFDGDATTLLIEQYSDNTYTEVINEFQYGAFSGNLKVDGMLRNVFLDDVMANDTFEGEFINLNGVTTPKFFNGGTFVDVSSNIVTLSDLASAVDDYYNGMSIYTINANSCLAERRVITDYNGTTKEATLDTAFDNSFIGQEYSIYNLKDGKNYFKITGTGFLNLNLLVDFRYVYL